MEGYIQERKGILGGLKVPFCDLPSVFMAILALILLKFGIFAFEKVFEEPFLLERTTVKALSFIGQEDVGKALVNRFGQPVFSNRPWKRTEADRGNLEKYAKEQVAKDPDLQEEINESRDDLFAKWLKHSKDELVGLKSKEAKQKKRADMLSQMEETAKRKEISELVDRHYYFWDQGKIATFPQKYERDKTGNFVLDKKGKKKALSKKPARVINDIQSIYKYETGSKDILSPRKFVLALLGILMLLLWAFFSTGISRCIAIRLARDDIISFKEAMCFAFKNFLPALWGSLFLAVLILFFFCCNYFAGLVAQIPYVSPITTLITSLLFFLVLISSMIITLISIGFIFGIQLIPSTIATEVSDTFDGVSRAIHYTFARPWEMLLLSSLVWIFLACFFIFSNYFINVTFMSVGYGWGAGFEPFIRKIQGNPSFSTGLLNNLSQWIIYGWFFLVKLSIIGYAIYYIPAAYTTIYFLLRKDVEGDNYSQIYIAEEEEEFIRSSVMEEAPQKEKSAEPKKEEAEKEEVNEPAKEDSSQEDEKPAEGDSKESKEGASEEETPKEETPKEETPKEETLKEEEKPSEGDSAEESQEESKEEDSSPEEAGKEDEKPAESDDSEESKEEASKEETSKEETSKEDDKPSEDDSKEESSEEKSKEESKEDEKTAEDDSEKKDDSEEDEKKDD